MSEKECIWARAYERLKYFHESKDMLKGPAVIFNAELRGTSSWANTFLGQLAPPGYRERLDVDRTEYPIGHVAYMIDNTAKTRAIFEIRKGINMNPALNAIARMSSDQRRVPIRNMIYVGDGPSDIPCFSIINERGGKTLGVYTTSPRNNFRGVRDLQEQGRVQGMAEADFRPGSAAYLWLMDSLDQIAEGILGGQEGEVGSSRRVRGRA